MTDGPAYVDRGDRWGPVFLEVYSFRIPRTAGAEDSCAGVTGFVSYRTMLFAGRTESGERDHFGHVRQFQISRVKKTLKPRPSGGEIFIAFSTMIIFQRG